jgi:transglutaminase-like putative cysteine protease
MLLDIRVGLEYALPRATDVLMQIEVADMADQTLVTNDLQTSDVMHFARVPAEDGIGNRIWLRADTGFRCDYTARVRVDRPVADIAALPSVPAHLLPGETVRYLMPSRFCPSDEFQTFVSAEFGHLSGGARIAAMCDWIGAAFTYAPGSSTAQTTALDTFVQRQGVCRDFAHVLITLARASTIPARFVSGYAPGVVPPDFHAVAEVFLDGVWHLIDPTCMAPADTIARIGVGADAAEVAFLGSFGAMSFVQQAVMVQAVSG